MFVSKVAISSLLIFATILLYPGETIGLVKQSSLDVLAGLTVDSLGNDKCATYEQSLRQNSLLRDSLATLTQGEIFTKVLSESIGFNNPNADERRVLADLRECIAQAHHEQSRAAKPSIVFDRSDLVALSKTNRESSKYTLEQRCQAVEGTLRGIYAKISPESVKASQSAVFQQAIEALRPRILPFGNNQPVLITLQECVDKLPSHRNAPLELEHNGQVGGKQMGHDKADLTRAARDQLEELQMLPEFFKRELDNLLMVPKSSTSLESDKLELLNKKVEELNYLLKAQLATALDNIVQIEAKESSVNSVRAQLTEAAKDHLEELQMLPEFFKKELASLLRAPLEFDRYKLINKKVKELNYLLKAQLAAALDNVVQLEANQSGNNGQAGDSQAERERAGLIKAAKDHLVELQMLPDFFKKELDTLLRAQTSATLLESPKFKLISRKVEELNYLLKSQLATALDNIVQLEAKQSGYNSETGDNQLEREIAQLTKAAKDQLEELQMLPEFFKQQLDSLSRVPEGATTLESDKYNLINKKVESLNYLLKAQLGAALDNILELEAKQ